MIEQLERRWDDLSSFQNGQERMGTGEDGYTNGYAILEMEETLLNLRKDLGLPFVDYRQISKDRYYDLQDLFNRNYGMKTMRERLYKFVQS